MASVSVTFSETSRERIGKSYEIEGTLTLAGTYVSTKVPVTPATFGLTDIERCEVFDTLAEGVTGTGTFLNAIYDDSNSYIKLYDTSTTIEAAADYDTDGATCRIVARGR